MKNSFYHEFAFGQFEFNYWTIVAPLLIVAMISLGMSKYYLSRSGKIKARFNNRLIGLASIISTTIFGAMLIEESWYGILQFCDNHLEYGQSAIYSFFAAVFGTMFVILAFWAVAYYIGIYASRMRRYLLGEELKEQRMRSMLSR
ncbi:MAG: hypothetical protein Q4B65_01045 [Candidatus Saccharibacteria bacterium]|nr:hypothetical protein [Candidatus Saccharibacteria bacterium]